MPWSAQVWGAQVLEPSGLRPLPVPHTFGTPASAPAIGAPQTPASHSPHCTVPTPAQNLSNTTPQLAPSVSQLEGHDTASGVPTTMKLESSPLAGMPEVDPLAMVASGPEEVP